MPTLNGLNGLNVLPIPAAPRLMDTTVNASKPTRLASRSNTGTSATISSHIPSTAPPAAKSSDTIGMMATVWCRNRSASQWTALLNAPVLSMTLNAPPARKIRKMTDPASAIPFGTAINVSNGPTGWGGTAWKVPATTTFRPVAGSSRRSYSPEGST